MKIKYSKKYAKQYEKIKNKATRIQINKAINRLKTEYIFKKHLRNVLSGKQTIRIGKFRLIYKTEKDKIELCYFKHRKEAYK